MTWSPPPKRAQLKRSTGPFWLIGLVQLCLSLVAAYLLAVFLYGVIDRIGALPQGPLWDPAFRLPVEVVLVIIFVCAFLAPFFAEGTESPRRLFWAFSAFFLVTYTYFRISHVVDPDLPLKLVMSDVIQPLRARFNF